MGARLPPLERGSFGGVSRLIVKYVEYLACVQCSQLYSLDGSGDAASCCQYCDDLFAVDLRFPGHCLHFKMRLLSFFFRYIL